MTKYEMEMVIISSKIYPGSKWSNIAGLHMGCQCMRYQEVSELGYYIKSLH